MSRTVLLLGVLAATVFDAGIAQDLPPLRSGDEVRLQACSASDWRSLDADEQRIACQPGRTVGRVSELGADSILIESRNGEVRSLALASLQQIEVSRGRRSNGWRGAAIGLLAGAPIGAVIGYSLGDDPPLFSEEPFPFSATEKAVFGTIIGAASGAIVGGLVGAMVHTDRWEEVPLERLDIALVPQREGQFALRLFIIL